MDSEYEIIKNEKHIAFLQDSDSKLRGTDIINKIYDVEMKLRSMLMYIPEITGRYHNLVKEKRYTKSYNTGEIARDNQFDTIVGHLTLGEMIELLGTDLSISNFKNTPWGTIEEIVTTSENFNELKNQFLEQMEHRSVWDILAKNVLKKPSRWNEVSGRLKKILDHRNSAAHFHTITEEEKNNLLQAVDELLPYIEIKRRLKKEEKTNLTEQFSIFSTQLTDPYSLFETQAFQNIAENLWPQIDPIADIRQSIGETAREWFSSAYDVSSIFGTSHISASISNTIKNSLNIGAVLPSYWSSVTPNPKDNNKNKKTLGNGNDNC